jgi:hypothetical protein
MRVLRNVRFPSHVRRLQQFLLLLSIFAPLARLLGRGRSASARDRRRR